jgi:NAD-dependent SIR2 family protein deacetylase
MSMSRSSPLDASVVGATKIVDFARTTLTNAKRLLVIVGAGLSTSAGVPDFRSPDSGLYSTLIAQGVADPQEVFNSDVFRDEPEIFWSVAHLFFQQNTVIKPTRAHLLLAAIDARGSLLRLYTQNVDELEIAAGIKPSHIIAAHGNAKNVRCVKCGKRCSVDTPAIVSAVLAKEIPYCATIKCRGVLRPEVVFFGESLPQRFHDNVTNDVKDADVILVTATSLSVAPLSTIHKKTGDDDGTPRIFINREMPVDKTMWPSFDIILLGEVDDIFSALFEGKEIENCEWIVDGPAARLIKRATASDSLSDVVGSFDDSGVGGGGVKRQKSCY